MIKEADGYAMSRDRMGKYLASRGIKFTKQPHGPARLREHDAAVAAATAAKPEPEADPVMTSAVDEGWLTVDADGNGSATLVAEDFGETSHQLTVPATHDADADLLSTLDDLAEHLADVLRDVKALRAIVATRKGA